MVEMPFVKVDERGGARQGARCPRDRPSPERGQDTCSRVMSIWMVLHSLCSAFVKVPARGGRGRWGRAPGPSPPRPPASGEPPPWQQAEDAAQVLPWASLLTSWVSFQILFTMARRPRSSRAWHFVLSAARRDADARAVALAGTANWGYDSDGQHSDSDSDPESSALPPPIPSAVPVTGESFCDCDSQSEASLCGSLHVVHRGKDKDCRCGEEDEYFDWVWDDLNKSSATLLSCDNRKVNFHMEYSCGTAAIRGTKELGEGQHFWEIKMTSPVYGTDMMVGIGTSDVDLDKYHHTFCSLLGRDEDSWGLSYTGLLHHKGDKTSFSSRFGQGSIIGVHLDTWHGTLTFFKNRKCIGVAATKLQNKKFYPMVCSTAAKSSMKVIRSCASITSLQYLCCYRLRQLRPNSRDTLEGLPLPPGLKQVLHHKLGWVLSMSCGRHKPPVPSPKATATPGSPEPRHCQRKRCRRT